MEQKKEPIPMEVFHQRMEYFALLAAENIARREAEERVKQTG